MRFSTRYFTSLLLCACLTAASASAANADEDVLDEEGVPEDVLGQDDEDGADDDDAASAPRASLHTASRDTHFIEATGAFGVQLGTSPYLPDGDGTTSHHPFTNGVAVGITGGFELLEGLSLIANFEHTSASSRDGQVENALDRVDGVLSYQTVVVGLRSVRTIGPGRMFGELAAGVVLPFETQLQYDYAPALSGLPMPVQGAGTKTDEYNLGFGAHGTLGYQVDVSSRYYLTAAAKLKGFATTNAGRKTRLDNFVTDFAAPAAVTAEVEYRADGTTGAAPSTYSVQDLRLQLAVGMHF